MQLSINCNRVLIVLYIIGLILLIIGSIGIVEEIKYNNKLVYLKTILLDYDVIYNGYSMKMDTNCKFVTITNRTTNISCQDVNDNSFKYYKINSQNNICFNCDHFTNCSACNYKCTSNCRNYNMHSECMKIMKQYKCEMIYSKSGIIYNCNKEPINAYNICNIKCPNFLCKAYNYECYCKCTNIFFTECSYNILRLVSIIDSLGYIVNNTSYKISKCYKSWEKCYENDIECIKNIRNWYCGFNPGTIYYHSDNPTIYHTYNKPPIGSAKNILMIIFGSVFIIIIILLNKNIIS